MNFPRDFIAIAEERDRLRHENSQLHSALAYRLQQLEDAKWLIRNGEKHFGSLWRDATTEDINAITRRAPPQPRPTFCEHVRCNLYHSPVSKRRRAPNRYK